MKKLSIVVLLMLMGCSRNVAFLKESGPQYLNDQGFKIIAYEGYKNSITGGHVWYLLQRSDSPGIIYNGFIEKWFEEIHLYNLKAISGNQINITTEVSK